MEYILVVSTTCCPRFACELVRVQDRDSELPGRGVAGSARERERARTRRRRVDDEVS